MEEERQNKNYFEWWWMGDSNPLPKLLHFRYISRFLFNFPFNPNPPHSWAVPQEVIAFTKYSITTYFKNSIITINNPEIKAEKNTDKDKLLRDNEIDVSYGSD